MNAAAIQSKTEIKPEVSSAPAIRILKIATCPSLSGQSKLTYHVGCNADEIKLRIYANSSSGYFSQEWVSLNAIQEAFAKVPADGAITSFLMRNLFTGKSTNTPGFVFAAMLAEGLVQPSSIVERCYECTDGKEFFAEVQTLIESAVDIKVAEKPKKSAPVMPETSIKKSPKNPRQKNSL